MRELALDRRRPATATLAPSRANASAMARPMPVPPPVIKATLPANRVTIFPVPTSNRARFVRASNKMRRHRDLFHPVRATLAFWLAHLQAALVIGRRAL